MKSFAKINLFLKILRERSDGYCEIASRFALFSELFDEVFLLPKELAKSLNGASIDEVRAAASAWCGEGGSVGDGGSASGSVGSSASGDFGVYGARATTCATPKSLELIRLKNVQASALNENILCQNVTFYDGMLSNFFTKSNIFKKVLALCGLDGQQNWSIVLLKHIPTFAGLGGASSNAAALLELINNHIRRINIADLAPKIGADVSFFASGAKCANVRGFGEIIEPIDDELAPLELVFSTPCDTAAVFCLAKRQKAFSPDASELLSMKNRDILQRENSELNDLLAPVLQIYPQTKAFAEKSYFLSGSGGTFFKFHSKGE